MSEAAIYALLALRDLGCVSASITNRGYVELARKDLVDTENYYRPHHSPRRLYRLNARGRDLAARIFK